MKIKSTIHIPMRLACTVNGYTVNGSWKAGRKQVNAP